MKRIVSLLLCVLFVLTAVSCGPRDSGEIDHVGNPLLLGGEMYPDRKETENAVNAVIELMRSGGTVADVSAAVDELYKVYWALEEQCDSTFLAYCLEMYSEADEAGKRYREAELLYDELYADITALMAASRGTAYETIFFEGYTEEEINEFLASVSGYDDEYVALSTAYGDLMDEYRNIQIETGKSDATVADLYAQMVAINGKIAQKFGYDNYLEYSYQEIYNRGYTAEEMHELAQMSIACLYPVLGKVDRALELTFASDGTVRQVNDFYTQGALAGDAKADVDAYFLSLGDGANAMYGLLHQKDLYFASSNPLLAFYGAFTDYSTKYSIPFCYFGPGYQDRNTVVHEMGHFMRMYLTENEFQSYDASEFNSQGNSRLFMAFMEGRVSERTYQYLMMVDTYFVLSDIYLDFLLNEFEYAVYTADSPSGADILAIFDETCERFGGYDILCNLLDVDLASYWQGSVVSQPGYYISYATGLIPALELYFIAQDDYSRAVEIYLSTLHDPSPGLAEVVMGAGLSDPFDTATLGAICAQIMSMDFLN